ncbi:MAG: radical SAM/SPASM domain-containing protein [Planctomycetota bacterium]
MAEILDRLIKIGIEKTIPLSGLIELTNKCNEQCIHCYRVLTKRKELTYEILQSLFDELLSLSTFFLTFSGGELFLHKDVLKILEYAKKLRFYVIIKTNGLLLDKQKILFLKDIGINRIDFSLYAIDSSVHDSITKKEGSYEKTLWSIKECKKEGLRVRINVPVLKHNKEEIENLIGFAEKTGIEKTFDPFISPRLDGNRQPLLYRLQPSEIKKVIEKLKNFENNREEIEGKIDTKEEELLNSIPCSAGFSQFYINSYGDVTPCVAFPYVCGNIFTQSFTSIWYKSQGFEKVRGVRIRDLPVCSSCKFFDVCNRCPGNAYIETGDFKNNSPSSCEYAFNGLNGGDYLE